MPFKVLTRYTREARRELRGHEADVRTVRPEQIPEELAPGDIGLCLYKNTFSRQATAPTRFAEYLSAGMPVAVTPGLGDLETIVEENRVGVVIQSEEEEALDAYASELRRLAASPDAVDRCRAIARKRFGVKSGVDAYERLYRRLVPTA
jgi:glycosyltransferase involved in cell wall biosynthesis